MHELGSDDAAMDRIEETLEALIKELKEIVEDRG